MRDRLKTGLMAVGLAMALGGASGAYAGVMSHPAANDTVAPARLDNAVNYAGQAGHFEKTQFIWAGRNYCWYPEGWRGPGYYWCGYAWRRGYGWGGPMGWHGWSRDWHRDWHDRGYGRDWHGDRGYGRDWHGGDRGDHGYDRGGDHGYDRGGDHGYDRGGDHGYDHGGGDHHDWHDDHH